MRSGPIHWLPQLWMSGRTWIGQCLVRNWNLGYGNNITKDEEKTFETIQFHDHKIALQISNIGKLLRRYLEDLIWQEIISSIFGCMFNWQIVIHKGPGKIDRFDFDKENFK